MFCKRKLKVIYSAISCFVLTSLLSCAADSSSYHEVDDFGHAAPMDKSVKYKYLTKNQPLLSWLVCRPDLVKARSHEQNGQDGQGIDEKVPRYVHQIWFGDASRRNQGRFSLWQTAAEKFDYQYRLWTEDDLDEIASFMPERNQRELEKFLAQGNFWAASDIVRISLLRHYGGIYVDADMAPPRDGDDYIVWDNVFPMRNVSFMGEHHPRNVNNGSVFVANGFMISVPNHPIFENLENLIVDNVASIVAGSAHGTAGFDQSAMYTTGPFFISCNLAGSFNVVPVKELIRLGMID